MTGAGAPSADGTRRLRAYLRRPPSHWVLFALVLAALLLALFAQGVAREEIGAASTSAPAVPIRELASVGPVLDLSGSQVRSASPPPGTVALTFDDGPDPKWTPTLLALLRAEHVHATFFVVGSQAVTHPELVRREVTDGHEVGVHTFTHADLGVLPAWRQNLELSVTETVLAGVTGHTSPLLRLPYSSVTPALTRGQFLAARRAARYGYLLVDATVDGRDWARGGVDRIVARATPAAGEGAIVLLHDGGGDRAETVAAVRQLIRSLRGGGYRFGTVSEVMGITVSPRLTRVSTWTHLQGVALVWSFRLAFAVTRGLEILLVVVAVLLVIRTVIVVALAGRHSRLHRRRASPIQPLPPATVIIPAYNEEVGIEGTVRSVLASRDVDIEVIVVDDGSADRTAEIVEAMREPRVQVIRQANGGKSTALNTGLASASHELVVMMDGDTQFEPGTVAALLRPFADPAVGGVAGNTKVGNRGGILGRWQHIEYVIGLNLDRRTLDVLGCVPTIPGAVGAFRRSLVESVGGASSDTLAEDTDLTIAVQRAGSRVVYEEEARAWTEAPAAIGPLWRQRYRWAYGNLQTMWKHRRALRDRSRIGRIGLPYMLFFQVLLPLLAPVIDLYALYGIVFLAPMRVLAYWVAFNAVSVGVGAYAFALDDESPRPLWALPLQQLVYRQLMYAVVIQSAVSAVVGARLRWHKLERRGIDQIPGEPVTPTL